MEFEFNSYKADTGTCLPGTRTGFLLPLEFSDTASVHVRTQTSGRNSHNGVY